MIDNLLALIGGALGAGGTVTAAFWKYEDVASLEAKQRVTRWLTYRGSTTDHPGCADHLVTAFNKIFGERHFSAKCFWRSCLASTIAICTMTLAWALLRPEEFSSLYEFLSFYNRTAALATLVIFIILVNCVPDYLSYMKTRMILKKLTRLETTFGVVVFAVLDSALTAMIFLVLFIGMRFAVGIGLGVKSTTVFFEWFKHIFDFHAVNRDTMSPSISFYGALFVSIWSWLYAVSALTTRFMVRLFPRLLKSSVWFFEVEGHPLRSLGCIAGGIVFLGVVAAKALAL
jgi:hypothetical protein